MIGEYGPQPPVTPCPSCGHCPTCGRSNGWVPTWQPPYAIQPTTLPQFSPTYGGVTPYPNLGMSTT